MAKAASAELRAKSGLFSIRVWLQTPHGTMKETWSPDHTADEWSPCHQPPKRAPIPTSRIGREIPDRHQATIMRLPQDPRDTYTARNNTERWAEGRRNWGPLTV